MGVDVLFSPTCVWLVCEGWVVGITACIYDESEGFVERVRVLRGTVGYMNAEKMVILYSFCYVGLLCSRDVSRPSLCSRRTEACNLGDWIPYLRLCLCVSRECC